MNLINDLYFVMVHRSLFACKFVPFVVVGGIMQMSGIEAPRYAEMP